MKSSMEVHEGIVVSMVFRVIFPYVFILKYEYVPMMESQIMNYLFGAYLLRSFYLFWASFQSHMLLLVTWRICVAHVCLKKKKKWLHYFGNSICWTKATFTFTLTSFLLQTVNRGALHYDLLQISVATNTWGLRI